MIFKWCSTSNHLWFYSPGSGGCYLHSPSDMRVIWWVMYMCKFLTFQPLTSSQAFIYSPLEESTGRLLEESWKSPPLPSPLRAQSAPQTVSPWPQQWVPLLSSHRITGILIQYPSDWHNLCKFTIDTSTCIYSLVKHNIFNLMFPPAIIIEQSHKRDFGNAIVNT